MYLILDTETTGVPRSYHAPLSDSNNWPRLVQIAWMQFESPDKRIASVEYIIKPEGFTIPASATRIHGITSAKANEVGAPLREVLEEFAAAVKTAQLLIAHNMGFDEKIIGSELLRAKMVNVLEKKRRMCTMKTSTDFCKLPGQYGYKWPSLTELHRILFRSGCIESHRARADVETCAKCFFELRRRGVVNC